jgi:hypothetical protein
MIILAQIDGGHMSVPESTVKTMKIWKIPLKELWEETGAKIFDLTPICIY